MGNEVYLPKRPFRLLNRGKQTHFNYELPTYKTCLYFSRETIMLKINTQGPKLINKKKTYFY